MMRLEVGGGAEKTLDRELVSNLVEPNEEEEKEEVSDHEKPRKTKKLYPCVRCEGNIFLESKMYLYKHLIREHYGRKDHDDDDLYSCRYCDKEFGLKWSRDAHQKTHSFNVVPIPMRSFSSDSSVSQ